MGKWRFHTHDGRLIDLTSMAYYLRMLDPTRTHYLVMHRPPRVEFIGA
jgi:hypothetical protein